MLYFILYNDLKYHTFTFLERGEIPKFKIFMFLESIEDRFKG